MGRPWAPLPDAPAPAASKPRRLTQMRQLARRFQAGKLRESQEPDMQRLLPQPIYRYQNMEAKVVDGAVFTFVEATDPEALVLLEAVSDADGGQWRYAVARMTSSPTRFLLDGELIWETKGYWRNPRSRNDSYSETFDSNYSESDGPAADPPAPEGGTQK